MGFYEVLYVVQHTTGYVLGEASLDIGITQQQVTVVAAMIICCKQGIADEVALPVGHNELHGKVLHLVVVGLGREVTVAADEGIGPRLYFFKR